MRIRSKDLRIKNACYKRTVSQNISWIEYGNSHFGKTDEVILFFFVVLFSWLSKIEGYNNKENRIIKQRMRNTSPFPFDKCRIRT